MKGLITQKNENQGPMSSAGIFSAFSVTGGGPKIKPEVVIVASSAIILFVLIAGML